MDVVVNKMFKKELYSLYIIQISNIIFPLITFVYLANILGVNGLGKIAFYQTVSMLIAFFVDFGFTMSASRALSVNLDNKLKIEKIYSNVQFTKYCLWVVFSIVFVVFIRFLNISSDDLKIFYIALLSGISSILCCGWVFQGLTKNSILAFITLFFKIVSTVLIFITVHSYSDLFKAIYLQLFSSMLVGFFCIYYIRKNHNISFKLKYLNFGDIIDFFGESYHNFIASFFTLGFTYLNPLLVKTFFGDTGLGLYSTAEKIINLLKQAFIPIAQTFYADMCRLSAQNEYKIIIKKNKKIFIFFSLLCLIALILNISIGNIVYEKIFGPSFQIVTLVSLMVIVQWIVSLAIVLVNLMIIPFGESRILKKVYCMGLIVYLVIIYPLLKLLDINGVVVALIVTEFFLVSIFFAFVRKFLNNKNLV